MLVETTEDRAMAVGELMGFPSVITQNRYGEAFETFTAKGCPNYGKSVPAPALLRPATPGALSESGGIVVGRLLQKIDSVFAVSPGAVLLEHNPGLFRACQMIAESATPEEAEQLWEDRPEEPESDPEDSNSDPQLWEGVGNNYELNDEDWEAMWMLREGDSEGLTDNQLAFLTEIGLVEDHEISEYGQHWVDAMSKERKDEPELTIRDETDPQNPPAS